MSDERNDIFPKPGELFEERYRVGQLIGSGGFSNVYRAVQEDLGRDVALKVMFAETPDEDSSGEVTRLVERFTREAKLVSRLRDPHTITMYDHGEAENGLLYMVFEFVDGISLSQLLRRSGAMHPRRVVKVLRQVLSSLEEAHSIGVLHRDIKPGNIMVYKHLRRMDQVKLLDFGIAKTVGSVKKEAVQDLTTDGTLVGTPRYMSPEQIRGIELTPQSDIYSLGLVAYEMLTGEKAIQSNSSMIIISRQLEAGSFELPHHAAIPDKLRAVVNRMLDKDLNRRFKTVAEVLDALSAGGDDLDDSDPGMAYVSGEFPAARSSGEFPVARTSGEFPVAQVSGGDVDMPTDISDMLEPLEAPSATHVSRDPTGTHAAPGGQVNWVLAVAAILGVLVAVGAVSYLMGQSGESSAEQVTTPTPAPDKPPESEPLAEARTSRMLTIRTSPARADVFINGQSRGMSPIELRENQITFPISVHAELDGGQSRTVRLDSYTPSLHLDVAPSPAEQKRQAEAAKAAEEDKKQEPAVAQKDPPQKQRPTVKRHKAPPTPKKVEKAPPADDTEKPPEEPEKGGGLILPPID